MHAVLQHVPWTHRPRGAVAAVRADRAVGLDAPSLRCTTPGGAQSASAVQVDLAGGGAAPGMESATVEAGMAHVPAPSQAAAGVGVVVLAGQVASRHGVPST